MSTGPHHLTFFCTTSRTKDVSGLVFETKTKGTRVWRCSFHLVKPLQMEVTLFATTQHDIRAQKSAALGLTNGHRIARVVRRWNMPRQIVGLLSG